MEEGRSKRRVRASDEPVSQHATGGHPAAEESHAVGNRRDDGGESDRGSE